MSGKIIEFRRHHILERARLYARQAVPRGPAGQARLDQRIARISGLLRELEDLTRGAGDLPSAILVQARASIERTSRILQPCTRFAASTGPEENGEDDPQPDVEHGLLERMYRALDLHMRGAMPVSGSVGDRGSAIKTDPPGPDLAVSGLPTEVAARRTGGAQSDVPAAIDHLRPTIPRP